MQQPIEQTGEAIRQLGVDSYGLYLAYTENEVRRSVANTQDERRRERPDGSSIVATEIDDAVTALVADSLSECSEHARHIDPTELIGRPPKNVSLPSNPDIALPMFVYAQSMRQNPALLARTVATHPIPSAFMTVEATGPYVNIRVRDDLLLRGITDIIDKGTEYGVQPTHQGEVAIIDYSGPNVAKPFGVGHLRSTVIGESISRLLDAVGFTIIRDNHLGDWGTQFGNLLAAYESYSPDVPFSALSIDDLNALYVRFSTEKSTSPRLVRKGRQTFARLESHDPTLMTYWATAQLRSREEFDRVYDRLGVRFDTQIGEGYFVESARELVDHLIRSAPDLVKADPDTGAAYIDSDEHPIVIRTGGGYCVYAARDLAAMDVRARLWNPDLIVYVVGEEQASSFNGVFDLADKVGLTNRVDGGKIRLEHVAFGLLLGTDGKKLSTRKGSSGKLEDVLDVLDMRAREEVRTRNRGIPEHEVAEIASILARGALIWNDLRNDKGASVRFDIEHMLASGGGGIIDVLYSYSRSSSLLNRVTNIPSTSGDIPLPESYSNEAEHQLAFALCELPKIISRAAEERSPHHITTYLQELARLHGRFYETSRIIAKSGDAIQPPQLKARLMLHRAYCTVVKNGLSLLNIPVTDRI